MIGGKRLFPRATDTILFYKKDIESEFTYKQLKEKRDQPVRQLKRKKVAGRMVNARDEHGNILYQVKEDRTLDNVWRIPCIQPADRYQRMGYPTQKPDSIAGAHNRGEQQGRRCRLEDPFVAAELLSQYPNACGANGSELTLHI